MFLITINVFNNFSCSFSIRLLWFATGGTTLTAASPSSSRTTPTADCTWRATCCWTINWSLQTLVPPRRMLLPQLRHPAERPRRAERARHNWVSMSHRVLYNLCENNKNQLAKILPVLTLFKKKNAIMDIHSPIGFLAHFLCVSPSFFRVLVLVSVWSFMRFYSFFHSFLLHLFSHRFSKKTVYRIMYR